MDELALFLANNPYLLAGLVVIGFWPVVKSLLSMTRKIVSWFFNNAVAGRKEIELAVRSPSYLISQIFILLSGLAISIWMSQVLVMAVGYFGEIAPFLKYIISAFQFLLGCAGGAFAGTLISFVVLVRNESKRVDSQKQPDTE